MSYNQNNNSNYENKVTVTNGGGGNGSSGGTTGGATEAKQDAQILRATDTNTKLDLVAKDGTDIIGAVLPAGGTGIRGYLSALWEWIKVRMPNLGQATMAASTPVVIANDQSALNVSTGLTQPLTDAQLRTTPVPVSLSSITDGTQISKDFLLAIDAGLVSGFSIVKKSGKNFDIDTSTVPESVWNGGGLYTGFPTSGFGTLQAFSSSAADVGTLSITYLATSASTAYTTVDIAINGTTPNNTTITAYRVHSAFYSSTANSSTQLNAGVITVRYTAAPAVVFLAMPAGRNQTYMAGYTIPAGKKGLLMPTNWRANSVAGAFLECAIYLRPFNGALRMRRNVSLTVGTPATDAYEGGILLDSLTDIMPTVLSSSANNVTIEASYTVVIFNA